jgi:hypothetical protein
VSRRGSEWTVYNADGKKFVIYAAHFDGDVTVAQRVKTVCVCKSDGKIKMHTEFWWTDFSHSVQWVLRSIKSWEGNVTMMGLIMGGR